MRRGTVSWYLNNGSPNTKGATHWTAKFGICQMQRKVEQFFCSYLEPSLLAVDSPSRGNERSSPPDEVQYMIVCRRLV
jgi:hypothetical protein